MFIVADYAALTCTTVYPTGRQGSIRISNAHPTTSAQQCRVLETRRRYKTTSDVAVQFFLETRL